MGQQNFATHREKGKKRSALLNSYKLKGFTSAFWTKWSTSTYPCTIFSVCQVACNVMDDLFQNDDQNGFEPRKSLFVYIGLWSIHLLLTQCFLKCHRKAFRGILRHFCKKGKFVYKQHSTMLYFNPVTLAIYSHEKFFQGAVNFASVLSRTAERESPMQKAMTQSSCNHWGPSLISSQLT